MSSNADAKPCLCNGCGYDILDKYLVNVNNLWWHSNCVKCHDCGCALEEKCYARYDFLYCRQDYFRRFGPECQGCNMTVVPEDAVRWIKNLVFHESCVHCSLCSRKFITGDRIQCIKDENIICEEHYVKDTEPSYKTQSEKAYNSDQNTTKTTEKQGFPLSHKDFMEGDDSTDKFLTQEIRIKNNMADSDTISADNGGYDGADVDDSVSSEPGDDVPCHRLEKDDIVNSHTSAGKKRGPRTTIKAKQLDMLKSAFISTPKPTRHIREQLAQDTGLSMRVIQVWFQNRRSKERRMKQVNMFSSRRHLYSTLPPSRLQESSSAYSVRFTDCQAPNINILEADAVIGDDSHNTRVFGNQDMPSVRHSYQLEHELYSKAGYHPLEKNREKHVEVSVNFHSNDDLRSSESASFQCDDTVFTSLAEVPQEYFNENSYQTDSTTYNNRQLKILESHVANMPNSKYYPFVNRQHATNAACNVMYQPH